MTNPKHAAVLGLDAVDRTQAAVVGGKGANLGELSRIPGLRVPPGVCVTTDAFRRALADAPAIATLLDRLTHLTAADRDELRRVSDELRRHIEATPLPGDVQAALTRALADLDPDDTAAWAVRSSATAEDLPDASFAGQQDTYLNIRGTEAVVDHVRRCWASLLSERAVSYRAQHGFDHRKVHMAVVVQRMLAPQAAGVLFTADPITSNRTITSIEATFGLGEALVAGLTRADRYTVRRGQILTRTIATKTLATCPREDGGTEQRALDPARQNTPVLTDAQLLALERLGRQIEAHFGGPQDIEWCLVDGELHIVQSRPITTLYPRPTASEPGNRIYISVGHQQMMTDAIKPLGLSVRQMTSGGSFVVAGGRLFADATRPLAASASRDAMLTMMGTSDPLIRAAIQTVLARGDFIEPSPVDPAGGRGAAPAILAAQDADDPALVGELIAASEAELAALEANIRGATGTALLDVIRADLDRMRRSMFDPRRMGAIMASMNAVAWLNDNMLAWLGEKNAADRLSQSVANNVTAQMGLALLDVADVIRPYPQVVAYLQHARHDDFLAGLADLDGGPAARGAIEAFLDTYGMRCAGEIDITRPRWREQPATLIPSILNNIHNAAPGAGARRFEHGRRDALEYAQSLLKRLQQLPDGHDRAEQTRRRIDRIRNFSGYREYPKYAMVRRYFVYRQALLQEAARLVHARVIRDAGDIDYLTFDELHAVVRTGHLEDPLVRQRRAEHALNQTLTPPRVLTSDGECLNGAYDRTDLPAGALVGLAVSSGVVEGRARVLHDMADATLEPGDILVTPFTDPGWTPLFVAIKGLVTEVGGLMTHGAVIAREYGLPAVVGVEHATRRIRDGQRIRVHGTDGYVELLA